MSLTSTHKAYALTRAFVADFIGYASRTAIWVASQTILAFAEEQASLGILYSRLSADEQTLLRQQGEDVIADVTKDLATREDAFERIGDLLSVY